jgi:nicotinamidase-related amidase
MFPGRPHTALLVIDVQNGVVAGAFERDRVVANVGALVDKARAQRASMIWVQHTSAELPRGSEVWRYVPELVRHDDEPLVHEEYGDSFEGTELEAVLTERRVGHLVVAGAQTDACIRSKIHGGFVRGYDVTLVGDAHTTEDLTAYGAPAPTLVIAHTNLYWAEQRAPGRRAAVVATTKVDFTGDAA